MNTQSSASFPKKREIFINGRFLTNPISGVTRYSHEIIRCWDELFNSGDLHDEKLRITCLVPKSITENKYWRNISIKPVGNLEGNLWEQIDLPIAARSGILFNPGNSGPYFGKNQINTIHDASVFAIPETYSEAFLLKNRIILKRMGYISKRIITVSQFSKDELVRWCAIDPQKIQVLYSGCDHILRTKTDKTVIEHLGLSKISYLLAVGSISPHKNINRLIQAIGLMRRQDLRLVFVGSVAKNVFRSSNEFKDENFIYAGNLKDEELRALYENAFGFVFPSLYEGFGFPPLEAMACGCPVVASSAASIPEICGNAAIYFDPLNVEDIRDKLLEFLSNTQIQIDLRNKGFQQAGKFKWAESARRTLEIILS